METKGSFVEFSCYRFVRIQQAWIMSTKTVTRAYLKLIIVCVFLLSPTAVIAQKDTGVIGGFVRDNNKQPIPGVTVTVSSPDFIGGSSIEYTDERGHYRFPLLAPGVYAAKAQVNGFQAVIQKDINLALGTTLTVDFTLEILKVSETIEVVDTPPVIDTTTTSVSAIVPNEIISYLAKPDNIQYVLSLTPGVSDDLIAYGADGPKANSIWIDGVGMSDSRDGRLTVAYDLNWIDQVQVLGIGAPAEFGGFTGVLGNFITRSGGNQFHGLFESFFYNENLVSINRPQPQREVPFTSYSINFQLGGPIIRDKLWFFSGIQYPQTQRNPFLYDGVVTEKFRKSLNKLTYKLNTSNTIQGFVTWNRNHIDPFGAVAKALPEATTIREDPQFSWNASWISLWGSDTTFEGRIGGFYTNRKDHEDQPDLPGHVDLVTGIISVNYFGVEQEKRRRFQTNAAVSHYAQNFIYGGHDFRFGAEFESSEALSTTFYNGGMFYLDYGGAPFLRYVTEGYSIAGSNRRISSYAQDNWQVTEDLDLSFGVRWDHNRGFTDRGLVYSSDPVAPRLGFVWRVSETNETVVKAHYGDYYEQLLERNFFFLTDGTNPVFFEAYENGNWVGTGIFAAADRRANGHRFKQPFVRQFNIGADHVLPHGIPVSVHYIYRTWGNFLEDVSSAEYEQVPFVNPITGETINVFNRLGNARPSIFMNVSGLSRKYHGFEVFTAKTFKDVSISGSVVFSRLHGNAESVSGSTGFLNDPNTTINYPGRLGVDRTFSWKIVGAFRLPFGFNAGVYFRRESGNTWTPTVFVPGLNQRNVRIFGEQAGSRRLTAKHLLDLRLEKEFQVFAGQLRGSIDVFNAFNASYALAVDTAFESPDFGESIVFNEPRQIRLGLRYTF